MLKNTNRVLPLAAITFLAGACIFPTERSGQLRVDLDSIPQLLEGELHQLSARVVDANGSPVPNGLVSFESTNPLVAIVSADGSMLATGVGITDIVARAVAMEGTEPASTTIRIHGDLEIDSITPNNLTRYGDTVRVFGAGLDPAKLFAVFLGDGASPILRYQPMDPERPDRFGVLTIWTRQPAESFSHVSVLGFNGLAFSPDSVRVLRFDIYEPNDTQPWDFGPVNFVANPALAFENRPRDSVATDWYRFTQTTTGDRTIVVRSDQVNAGSFAVFVTDSLFFNTAIPDFDIGPNAWTVGLSTYVCRGVPFTPPQFPADSSVVAIRNLPAGTYDILVAYQRPGPYGFGILPSYVSALPPDVAEENDYCDVAAPIALDQTTQYTIDNPHDIDWFTFTNTAAGATINVDVRATEPDADLDVYILQDFTPDSLPVLGVSQVGGATDAAQATLPAGNFFLVVVDFAGRATDYTLTPLGTGVVPDPAVRAGAVPTYRRGDPVSLRPGGSPARTGRRP